MAYKNRPNDFDAIDCLLPEALQLQILGADCTAQALHLLRGRRRGVSQGLHLSLQSRLQRLRVLESLPQSGALLVPLFERGPLRLSVLPQLCNGALEVGYL